MRCCRAVWKTGAGHGENPQRTQISMCVELLSVCVCAEFSTYSIWDNCMEGAGKQQQWKQCHKKLIIATGHPYTDTFFMPAFSRSHNPVLTYTKQMTTYYLNCSFHDSITFLQSCSHTLFWFNCPLDVYTLQRHTNKSV